MKLAKKMLVCLMALVMVAVIGISASATSVSVTGAEVEVGKEVTVDVAAAGFAGAYSGNLEVKYDASVLEYVSSTSAVGIAGNPEAGTVTIAFMYMNAATDASASLATITFKAIAAGDANITVDVTSWEGENDAASATASGAAVKVVEKPAETTTEKPAETTTEKPAETTTEKPAETTTEKPAETTTKKAPVEPSSEAESTTIIIVPGKDGKDAKDVKDPKFAKDPKLAKKIAAKKIAKVAQTGDTAIAVIAGIMAIGAVGFIATKKREF